MMSLCIEETIDRRIRYTDLGPSVPRVAPARRRYTALRLRPPHRIHSAHILEISDHLPIKIEFIESREKVEAILPELEKRIGSGLIEMQETMVIVPAKG